jgi:hypothetical protein
LLMFVVSIQANSRSIRFLCTWFSTSTSITKVSRTTASRWSYEQIELRHVQPLHLLPLDEVIPRPRPPKPPLAEGTPRSVFAGRWLSVVATGFCFWGVSFLVFLPFTSSHWLAQPRDTYTSVNLCTL